MRLKHARILSLALGTVALVATSLSTGPVRAQGVANSQRQALYRDCHRWAQKALVSWAEIERTERISCLDSDLIPRASYDGMMTGFMEECADAMTGKMKASLDEDGDHSVRIPGRELRHLFVRHYDPVFRQYCSSRNPGRGLNPAPARSAERAPTPNGRRA